MRRQRWQAILGALLLLLTTLASLAVGDSPGRAQSSPDLVTAVQIAASADPASPDTGLIVSTVTEQGDWAYGTVVTPAAGDDDAPRTRFFLAHREDELWTVTFRYSPAFDALLSQAPGDFPSPAIRASLESVSLASDGSSQLSFPFPVGETWGFYGPHPPVGGTVRNGLDFYPYFNNVENAPVLAMRGGIVYRPCANMILIDHGDGWTTGYYHVINIAVQPGQHIMRGQKLGGTSAETGCGGWAGGPHVHIWVEYQQQPTAIAGRDIGGWTVEAGPDPYDGCLRRDGIVRCTGTGNNYIVNDGDVGSESGSPLASLDTLFGAVGDAVPYTIKAFPPNTAVDISWRRPGGSVVTLGSVTTDADGDATGTITVPATTGGAGSTVRFTAGTLTRAIGFSVYSAIGITRDVAGPGEQVTIKLSGFSKQADVTLDLVTNELDTPVDLGSVTTNNTGGASKTVTIPADIPNGPARVEAVGGGSYTSVELFIADRPLIAVQSLNLPAGEEFNYRLVRFPANSAVTVTVTAASGGDPLATLPSVTTDATGKAIGVATAPLLPHGDYLIRAESGAVTATDELPIEPGLVVPPGTAARGSQVTITGRGFAADGLVTLSWVPGATAVMLGSATADTQGTVTITFTVPPEPDGWITLRAADATGADAFQGLQIAGGPMPGPPEVEISPVRSTVNSWVAYTLSNYPGSSQVTIVWQRASGSTLALGSVDTDSTGAATGRVRVPATTGGTGQMISFTSGDVTVSADVEVVPRIKVTPSPASRGSAVDVSLRGFGKKEVVRIRWKQGSTWVEVARVTTSNTGSANFSVTVPNWAPDGANSVRGDGTTFRAQTNVVQISGGSFTPANVIATSTATASPLVTATVPATVTVEPTSTATATLEPSPTETTTSEQTATETETETETPAETATLESTATEIEPPPGTPEAGS